MGKHSVDRRVVVGNYVRKPRMRFSAVTIVSRLWVERVNTMPAWRMGLEPFPTRQTITRHAVIGWRGESTMATIARGRGR